MNIQPGFGLYKTPAAKPANTAFTSKASSVLRTNGTKMSAAARRYNRQAASAIARLQDAIGCVKAAPVFMGPQSSDTRSVELSYTGSKFDSFEAITMNVTQEARAQQNTSFAQDVAGSDYAAGSHTFAVDLADGKSVELTVEVTAGESNASVQQKMATAINSAGLGITAGVSTHNDAGRSLSTLTLATKGMGDDAVGFTLRDVGNSSLVYQNGLNRVAQEAQNAVYTVNGKEYTSTSNTVDVGNGVTATIRCASKGDFSITDGFHEINAKNMMSILYTPLNDLKVIAGEMKKETGDDFLLLKMEAMFNQTASVLGSFGVTTGRDGLFTLDFAKADRSIADGSLRSFLQDFYTNGGGFIGYLEDFAANALAAPAVDRNV